MAGRGPAPKDPDRRQRRNAAPSTLEIPADAKPTRPPALPRAPRSLGTWSAPTKAWYETWRRSPQGTQFTATDWQRLHMLAMLVEEYFRVPSKELLAEIRLNEAKLGGTPEDRARLHWKITDGAQDQGETRPRSRRRKDPRLELIQGGGG